MSLIFVGYHMNLDFRMMDPKPFMEIFPVIYPLHTVQHRVQIHDKVVEIPPNTVTAEYGNQRSYETALPVSPEPTVRLPLGTIVHSRSGDKADNSNIGFFVRHADEYAWLQNYMTIARLQELFGKDWKPGCRVERCEFPNIFAVHFRVLDFLDGGIASSSRVDGLGKAVGEYLRSRYADLPVRFVERRAI